MINGYVHILVDYGLVRTLQPENEERRGEGVRALKIFSFWTVSAVGCRTLSAVGFPSLAFRLTQVYVLPGAEDHWAG